KWANRLRSTTSPDALPTLIIVKLSIGRNSHAGTKAWTADELDTVATSGGARHANVLTVSRRITMRGNATLFTVLVCGVVAPILASATPAAGVVSNVIVAQGATQGSIKERAQVGDGWAVRLDDQGASEFYFQDLVIGPGGYTGWHSHPGILLITVKEGSLEFFDRECTKHTYAAGQSFTEGADPHAAMNRGTSNARLLVAYIVKKGEPRRIE